MDYKDYKDDTVSLSFEANKIERNSTIFQAVRLYDIQSDIHNYISDIHSRFTNHSGKRTCATVLFQSDVDEPLIMDRTGHRSTAVTLKLQ